MRKALFVALTLLPLSAYAQSVPAPASPAPITADPAKPPPLDLVLLPRSTIVAMLQQVQAVATLHPELATTAVTQAFQQINACLADNPVNGVVQRVGQDLCTGVTEELAARAQEKANAEAKIAELTKQLDAAKGTTPKPVAPPKP